jgi:hypothetical protein
VVAALLADRSVELPDGREHRLGVEPVPGDRRRAGRASWLFGGRPREDEIAVEEDRKAGETRNRTGGLMFRLRRVTSETVPGTKCRKLTRATLPAKVGGKYFGPQLAALSSLLAGAYR